MGHEFADSSEITVDATPDQVWEAIATGPGIDSWFMGRNDVTPGAGGTVRTAFGSYTPASPITGWEPPHRLAYGGERGPDGRFVAYEFLVEGRAGSSTVLRTVTSGFLPGDDWEGEYDAMTKGWAMFSATLTAYLNHFAGRTATPVTAFGPPVTDWPRTWAALARTLGLADLGYGTTVAAGACTSGAVDGVVYFVNPHTVGVRTGDALYRFLRGYGGSMVAAHHLFSPTHTDIDTEERSWQTWLTRLDAR
jgi:uncharacterized protein YndB with AHSA1/START domain